MPDTLTCPYVSRTDGEFCDWLRRRQGSPLPTFLFLAQTHPPVGSECDCVIKPPPVFIPLVTVMEKMFTLHSLQGRFFFSFPLAFFHQHVLASLLNVIFSVTHRSSGHVILTFIKPLVTRISAAQQGPKALNVWTLV